MIQIPHTYAEWVNLFDILKQKTDDEDVLAAMLQGTIVWQAGVAERFSKKLIDTVNGRMNDVLDKFQKDLGRANGQERVIIQALLSLRKEMKFLLRVVDLPALPERERSHYKKLVSQQADKMQSSLEDSARNDRSGKLLSLVRNHKVNSFQED